ncbi:plasma-membrane choline transporter-domain-containing protein [Russula dissimulans]|nr:plasma-membrane choline transporter-domain-containing protein [Russula dissimulans]
MSSSFATYASQFLNRQRSPEQPLFFSFSTDDESQHGSGHLGRGNDSYLDDGGDPHLRSSENTSGLTSMMNTRKDLPDDGDDPYLRLDEVESGSQYPETSIRLPSFSQAPSEQSRGWLAHQPTHPRSPSPSSSGLDDSPPILSPQKARAAFTPSPLPPPPPPLSLSLTQSLLPRDGHTRPIDLFSLPDPRYISSRSRRKFHDPIWTSIWLAGLSICVVSSLLSLFLTHKPLNAPRSFHLPYTIFLHTIPLLVILTFTSAAVSYAHILLLRVFVKPVVIGTSVFIPATLLVSSIWAFVGSFMWESNVVPTWGETWGLRLFSLALLALAFITGRRLLTLPQMIHSTSSVLTLTTQLLSSQPLLLLLSPTVLLAALLASIPFLTLTFRLLLVGYVSRPSSGFEWHLNGWANWAIALTISMWFWTWAVARGALRVTTAGVIAAWYFADPTLPLPPPMDTHRIRAALYRATQPSLGSIALAGLLLTLTRMLLLLTFFLRQVPVYLPIALRIYTGPLLYAAGYLEDAAGSLSKYALVYVGLTGEGFWVSARRARALVTGAESGAGRFRKNFKSEPPLTLLRIAPLTLTLPFALTAYLFVAHTLGAPDQALSAALLAGTVTALVGLFCVGLVADTADTLYLCYCIDKESGDRRRAEVFELFEYKSRRQQSQAEQQQGQQQAARLHRPQPVQPPAPHAPQPISQRVEGIASPESSPELSPTVFQVDLEGQRQHPPPQHLPGQQRTAQALQRQESSEMDPFLPDLDAEPEPEPPGDVGGYDVSDSDPAPDGTVEDDEGTGSALFPGSDIF